MYLNSVLLHLLHPELVEGWQQALSVRSSFDKLRMKGVVDTFDILFEATIQTTWIFRAARP